MLSAFQNITPQSISADPLAIKSKDYEASRKRRPHHKSRKGCDVCRQRHLKCDEERPECGQCLHGKRLCSYVTFPQTDSPPDAPELGWSRYVPELRNELSSMAYLGGVDPLKLFEHFHQDTDIPWMGSADLQALLQQNSARLALGSPFLLHAMLAFSACHLASLYPDERRYAVAGAWNYSFALKSYRLAIDEESANGEAIFACCMLLTLLSFKHLADYDDVYQGRDSPALDTVSIRFIGGPRVLADAMASRVSLDKGIWKPLVRRCEDSTILNDYSLRAFPRESQSMAALEAFCRGDELGTPFDTALLAMRQLMHYYAFNSPEIVRYTFCFAIKLDPRFLRLVDERAPKSLLVLCYWYALVMKVGQWWAYPTAQIEGLKLLDHLRNSGDAAMQELLDFPGELLKAGPPTMPNR